jgi:DNA-binding NtrC family response regulator
MPFDAFEVHMANILVVDDEIGIRELLSEILSDEGHVVTTAESAASARTLRRQSAPDLILLDIWMPDTDGVTLLKEWVAGGQLTTPVIMMSGHATLETAAEATRLGAQDFLEKPIALARLLGAVRSGLDQGQRLRGPRTAAAAGPAGTEDAPLPRQRSGALEAGARGDAPVQTAQALAINLDQPLREARDQFERVYFEYQLSKESYSMTRVADRAGLERTHLYRKLKQLGVELGRGARRTERFESPAAPAPGTAAASGQDE